MQAVERTPVSGLRRLVVVAIAVCLAQIVLAQFLTDIVASGHAVFHALFALAVLLPALAIAWRWPAAGLASRAPVLGLLALAAAQFVESLGAFGYAPDNDTRANGMVALHDIGLALTALGLMAAVAGVVLGVMVAAGRRTGTLRLATMAAAALLGVGGILVVKLMIGF